LGVRRQRLLLRTADDHRAPQAALDDDRRADGRPQPGSALAGDAGERARTIAIVVDPGRTTRLEYERGGVLPPKLQPGTSRQDAAGPESSEGSGRIVGLIADPVH